MTFTADTPNAEVHHIIPHKVYEDFKRDFKVLFNLADSSDFQQMGSNFIYLYPDYDDGVNHAQEVLSKNNHLFGDISIGGSRHKGSHTAYDNVVRERLDDIFNSDKTPVQKQKMIFDLQGNLRSILRDRGDLDFLNKAGRETSDVEDLLERELETRNTLNPSNIDTADTDRADNLLNKYNDDLSRPESDRMIAKIFNKGTRETTEFAEKTSKKIVNSLLKINENMEFLDTESVENLQDQNAWTSKKAREKLTESLKIYNDFLELPENKLSHLDDMVNNSTNSDIVKEAGRKRAEFIKDWQQATQKLLTAGENADDLLASLKSRAFDQKAYKLLAQLEAGVKDIKIPITADEINNITDKENSAIHKVLEYVQESGLYRNKSINGTSIATFDDMKIDEMVNACSYSRSSCDVASKKAFAEIVLTDAVTKTEIVKAKNGGKFDRQLFNDFKFDEVELTETESKTVAQHVQNVVEKFDLDGKGIGKVAFAKGLKALPVVGILAGVAITAQEAQGKTEEEQKEIWAEFGAGEIGSEVVSYGAGLVTGAVLVALGVASAPVAIVAGLAVGIGAGIYGEGKGKEIYQLTKDKDGNGKADIFDKLGKLIYGDDNVDIETIKAQFKDTENNPIIKVIDTNHSITEFVKMAQTDIAYRYALLKLNPFVVKNINYDKYNENGELEFNNQNFPDGMTEQYIIDRTKFLLEMINEKTTVYEPRAYYEDIELGVIGETSHSGQWGAVIPKRYIFGSKGDDINLQGGSAEDHIYGGKGNDTLIGGKGSDYLEGGTGFDTYVIEGNDTIFDSDGKGEIKIGKDTISLNQDFSKKSKGNNNIWENEDQTITAQRHNTDLIIKTDNHKNQVKIKDYFKLANKSDDNSYEHLGVTLEDVDDNSTDTSIISANPNYTANIYTGGLDKPLIIYGSEQGDNIYANGNQPITAYLNKGNNLIYASTKEDLIYGGENNDVIHGSSPYHENTEPNKQPQNDHDIIYGGKGADLINGNIGNDFLYGNDFNSYTTTTKSLEQGDWIIGGSGNDTIFGSASRDFLQGGKDEDMIFGGANDDVILGDGNIKFGVKSATVFDFTDVSINNAPTQPTHPLLPPNYNPVITHTTPNTLSIDYHYRDNDNGNKAWQSKSLSSLYLRANKTFDWTVEIDPKSGQYTLTTKVKHKGDHSVQSDNANDYLYGGVGNDLVIGQYGDDYLEGNDGNDILWGDDNKDSSITGNDILKAGLGADTLYGGLGFDTYLFSKEDLSDSAINTIIDKDNNGMLKINGQNWLGKQWEISKDDNNGNLWTDGQGNRILETADGYLISSDNFTAKILIEGQLNDNREILGMKLANPNHAPTVANQQADQVITAEESFSLTLANDLFSDEDGDKLEYSLSTDNGVLPEWLHFNKDSHTLSGTAPINSNINLTLTATDPTGDSAEQSFSLISNARPTLNQALDEVLYLSAEDNEWKYQLPKNTFSDKDGDSLNYQITMADGSNVPTAITIDNNTGEIHVNATQLPVNENSNSTFDIKIIATDEHGVSVSTKTQLQVTNSYIEASSDNTIMGATWGKMGNDVIVASDDKEHTIHAMMGDDTLKGGAGIDKLNGGIGDDTLIGGQGDDLLNGGIGDDTYVYHKGDGNDSIFDWTGEDSLQLTDFTIDDLLVSNENNNLLIKFKDSETDSITIGSANAPVIGNLYAIESFVFADRTLGIEEIRELG